MITKIQSVLANICVSGMFYMVLCFSKNLAHIKALVKGLETFEKYSSTQLVIDVDRKSTLQSKLFLAYSVMGMLTYSGMPLLSWNYCQEHKTRSMEERGVPCGLITRYRLPFRYDWSPIFEVFVVLQSVLAGSTTVLIVNISMMICGLMMHVTSQLRRLRSLMKTVREQSGEEMGSMLRNVVIYHTEIIK